MLIPHGSVAQCPLFWPSRLSAAQLSQEQCSGLEQGTVLEPLRMGPCPLPLALSDSGSFLCYAGDGLGL